MHEMKVDGAEDVADFNLGLELGQLIQFGLLNSPVVLLEPEVHELSHERSRDIVFLGPLELVHREQRQLDILSRRSSSSSGIEI